MRVRKIFRGNRKEQRDIIEDSSHLRFEEQDIDVYIKITDDKQYPIRVQIFEGNKAKPTIYSKYSSMGLVEEVIKKRVELIQSKLEYKLKRKLQKQEKQKELKENLKPGTIIHTSFSYNMTFNKFYKVISNKRNTYQLEVLSTEWVDGDIGWTGNVKAGSEIGSKIEGKLTSNGLKIDNLYGSIISGNETFYENYAD